MRSFLTVAALAAAFSMTSLTIGYAQSRDDQTGSITNEEAGHDAASEKSTSSIKSDASDDVSVQSDHEESDTAPTITGTPSSPCPSGLGTGNGDCR